MSLASPISARKLRKAFFALWSRMLRIHDRTFSEAGKVGLKHAIVRVSVAGFLIHLGLILMSRSFSGLHLLTAIVGTNYLTTIATPFNFVLFYEVMTLIAALPASTTRSMANQFEIISLIFIRDVFKDFSAATEPDWFKHDLHAALALAFDMWSGVLMFVLATVFQHLAQRQVAMPKTAHLVAGREEFTAQKKVIAIGLTILLLALAILHLARFMVSVWRAAVSGDLVSFESANYFYNDLFTVMLFTDVLVLILSLVVSGRFEMVFRNAAFVASIIVIRSSLTEARPYGAIMALSAMAFAIVTLLIFNYHSWIRVSGLRTITDDQ